MRILLCLGFLLALPAAAQAQDTSEPKAWIEKFLAALVSDGADGAHRLLLEDSHLGRLRPEAIRGIRENMLQAERILGPASGYEFLAERRWGSSIMVFITTVKRQDAPVIWRYAFYRDQSGWNLVSFALFDDVGNVEALWSF